MKHRVLLIVVVVLVTLVTLACGLTGGEDESAQPSGADSGEQAAPPAEVALPLQQEPRARPADGMIMLHVPAGEFLMGSGESPFPPEKPEHVIYLDEYWIDRTEVTNAQYRRCVEGGACVPPKTWENADLSSDGQPVLTTWGQAAAYCAWAGGRLPSEAEWEKAARGLDGRKWPWGSQFEDGRANLSGEDDGYMLTAPVGSFPAGASPYGLLDVAGNAAEWVADWYDEAYYTQSPGRNPAGPGGGTLKAYRSSIANGGGGPEKCRCVARYSGEPENDRWAYGFRCAATQPPMETAGGQPSPVAEQPTASADQPTAPPEPTAAGQEPAPPSESSGDTGAGAGLEGLNSYRTHGVEQEEGSGETVQYDGEWVFEPFAAHMKVETVGKGGLEMIVVGSTLWTRMIGLGDGSWQQTTLSEDEIVQFKEEAEQTLAGAPAYETDEPPWPEDIAYLPGQLDLPIVEGSLAPAGEETVNGVHCKKYSLNSDYAYTYSIDLSGSGDMTTFKIHIQGQGDVWIADQGDLPPMVVRARVQTVKTSEGPQGQTTEIRNIEYDVTDINTPITIEPPQ